MYEIGKSKWNYLKNAVVTALAIAATYAACWFIIGQPFYVPEGSCFAVVLVWLLGHVGGFLAVQCRIPALLGMLILGVVFENVPGDILRGYLPTWEAKIKAFGLATILMRAGLKINYTKAFRQSPWTVVLLGAVPVFVEGFIDSAIFNTMFGMPYLLAATAGFLLSAVSPTVIVTGMLDLQKKGFGSEKNIPSVEMAAAGVDVVCGIAMFSIFESLAMQQASGNSDQWLVARGAVSVGLGIVAAAIGGILCGCTQLFNTPAARTIIVFTLGQMFMFILYYYGMTGGGALAAIATAGTAAICWQFGFPGAFSTGASDAYRTKVDEHLAVFWMYVMQPLLFCTIGTSVDFKVIPGITIPKAIVVIVVGAVSRMVSAALSCIPAGWSVKEMLFVALSWIAKATVQGALSAQPLNSIQDSIPSTADNYQEYVDWGYEILATAVLAIFITAPIALLFINLGGPKLLEKDAPKDPSRRLIRTSLDRARSLRHSREIEVVVLSKETDGTDHPLAATSTISPTYLFGLQMDGGEGRVQRDVGVQVDPRIFLLDTATGETSLPAKARGLWDANGLPIAADTRPEIDVEADAAMGRAEGGGGARRQVASSQSDRHVVLQQQHAAVAMALNGDKTV